jgi:hypothetical protein
MKNPGANAPRDAEPCLAVPHGEERVFARLEP